MKKIVKKEGMACFVIGGTTPHDMQLAVDCFFSKCDGFIKVIKARKDAWIVYYETEQQAKEAQQALDMIRVSGIPQ